MTNRLFKFTRDIFGKCKTFQCRPITATKPVSTFHVNPRHISPHVDENQVAQADKRMCSLRSLIDLIPKDRLIHITFCEVLEGSIKVFQRR